MDPPHAVGVAGHGELPRLAGEEQSSTGWWVDGHGAHRRPPPRSVRSAPSGDVPELKRQVSVSSAAWRRIAQRPGGAPALRAWWGGRGLPRDEARASGGSGAPHRGLPTRTNVRTLGSRVENEAQAEPEACFPDAASVDLSESQPRVAMWVAERAWQREDDVEHSGAFLGAQAPHVGLEARAEADLHQARRRLRIPGLREVPGGVRCQWPPRRPRERGAARSASHRPAAARGAPPGRHSSAARSPALRPRSARSRPRAGIRA